MGNLPWANVTQLAYRALIENDQIFSSERDMRVRRAGNRAACLLSVFTTRRLVVPQSGHWIEGTPRFILSARHGGLEEDVRAEIG